jgi:predicted dehydrogenase
MEAMWMKFQPIHQEIYKRIRAGVIGDIKVIEGNFGFIMPFDNNHRLFNFELGGGSALDQGVYSTTLCNWYAGVKPQSQVTYGENFANGADAHVETILRYPNGITGYAFSSLIASLGTHGKIVGEEGSIEFIGAFLNADGALIKGPFSFDTEQSIEEVRVPKLGAGYAHMLQEVVDCINAGKIESDVHPLDITIETMEILDEVRKQINYLPS